MATQTIAQETRAGDGFFAAGRERLRTREERALALYREHGREIEQVAKNLFWVPSQDAQREHLVRYPVGPGETESCSCPDHQFRHMTCIHILVAAIHHAKKSAQRRRNFIASVFAIAAGDDEG